jgi:hypothetical protein
MLTTSSPTSTRRSIPVLCNNQHALHAAALM